MSTPAEWRRRRADAAARLEPLRSGHRDPDAKRRDAPDAAYAAWEQAELWHHAAAIMDRADQPGDNVRDQAPVADETPDEPDRPTTNPAPPDHRGPLLTQFANEHRQQPGKLRHDFPGYDQHLRLDCPLCLFSADMPSSVRPKESDRFEELMTH